MTLIMSSMIVLMEEDSKLFDYLSRCYYGRCYGMYEGESCQDTRDCMPGFYCNNGITEKYIPAGKECTTDESCGRMARCAFVDMSDKTKRTCVPYFSVEDGREIYVKSEYDVFLCETLTAEEVETAEPDNEDNPLSNFRVDVTMKCGTKYKSINKGINCYEYRCDVADSEGKIVSGRIAQCDCFMDTTGVPVCGPMNGDIEFDQYRAAFRSYMEQSRYCHPMRDLEFECGDKQAYYNL